MTEEEKAKKHAEICNCGSRTLHEYIENHFKDLDKPSRRKYERVMGTWKSEDYAEYSRWFIEMISEPAEEELRCAKDILEKRKNDISEIYDGIYSVFQEIGLRNEAMEFVLDGLRGFPEVPHLYELVGHAFLERGWVNDAKDVLEQGLEKFPSDESINELLQKVRDNIDDPPGGEPLGLFLIAVAVSVHRKLYLRKKWR